MDPAALMDFLGLSTGEVDRMLLVMTRISGLFLAAPFFSRSAGPVRIRVVLILALTIVIFPLVPPWSGEGKGDAGAMVLAGAGEMLIGAMIGLITQWVLIAAQLAGNLIGFEMGLSMAQIMDPTSGMQENVVSNLLYFVGLMLFLMVDGHHMLLEGIIRSFKVVPPGSGMPDGQVFLQTGLAGVVRLFRLGFMIAAPMLVASKLLYIGMGLINRASPQMQVFFMAMPLAQLLGFLILGLSMAIYSDIMAKEIRAFISLAFRFVGM
ncbi:MAG: flagellar biosynthetic protein FliR [Magnetococcales bacterium]|nr:flagellar biosynthetic protein FliR [Magnetococcales bacterium]MBF0322528.1 flagellar biosynthetic protein FliR [Magnetococcales bacterium]